MMLYSSIFCVLFCLHFVSAGNPLEALLKLKDPCFEETAVPAECDTMLEDSFNSSFATSDGSEPTTHMYLFTPDNPHIAEPLHKCGGRLPSGSTYDPGADTEIFIHGWLDGICRSAWMREMKEQLKKRARYNVILVDWTWGNFPDYVNAGFNARITGQQVGFVINNIMSQMNIGPEKFHVVGHSFGAIASGYTGRLVKGLRRITALDPAYAPYGDAPPNERITYKDAKIVDVIHSNGAECLAVAIGDSRPLGHADFYPNGGVIQAGCYPYILTSLLAGDILYGVASLEPRLCPHVHAIQFYKVSINPEGCEFVGIASRSFQSFLLNRKRSKLLRTDWAVMGMNYELYHNSSDTEKRKYYLTTRSFCPYYDNSYLIGSKGIPSNVSCNM